MQLEKSEELIEAENVCDLEMFVEVQLFKKITRGTLAKRIVRRERFLVCLATKSAIVSHQEWEKTTVKLTTTFPWVSRMQPITRPNLWATRSRHKRWATTSGRVETDLPEWLQPFTEGLTGGSSSSTDVSPADVEIPPQAIAPPAHLPAKSTSNRASGKHRLSTHFPKDPNCEVCRRTIVTTAQCRRNPDDRADRFQKNAEIFGDMITVDHKVLNEDQEFRWFSLRLRRATLEP